ncbi:4-hydroxy-tetrahydrodipicolinate synthase 2 [Rhizocola hellebori]|uniref:4-hydroxy-tetrahydrodipicolinate synthase 2 n=1 Tax=Rhizocola hellebori TaxID=1392758 RepID=A0A8J3VI74_9ACTN|nr:dihydrodipicolinate synthase family protein [Rhizocola hellebori]GIH06731.1 4-hydroxy-tetrahydrodipicolinate synthase 2 [Rhizocola hellebori]
MTLTGLYVPLITPLDADGDVALAALEKLAHVVLDNGANGLVALGTTGEPGALSDAEQRAVVTVAARVCRERNAQLLVGANTTEALQGLRDLPELTAALSLVPPFVRPGEAGVLAHFTHLATAGVPLVVYHIPHRTAQHVSTPTLHALAAIPGVIGVKYGAAEIDPETVALLADPPPGCAVLGGTDAIISPLLAMGAHGGILASAHVATTGFAELIRSWQSGDAQRAASLGHRLAKLSLALFAEPNPTVIKGVLHARGEIPTPAVRLPLLPAHPDTVRTAMQLLEECDTDLPGQLA